MVNGVQSAIACSLFIQFHSNNDFDKRCVHHAKNECSFKYQHFRGENNGRKKKLYIYSIQIHFCFDSHRNIHSEERERKSEKNACCTIDDDEQ